MKNLLTKLSEDFTKKLSHLVTTRPGHRAIRKRPAKLSEVTGTGIQLERRELICKASHFLSPIKPLLKAGFKGRNWYQAAFWHLIKHAVSHKEAGFEIDYSALKLSNGKLATCLDPLVCFRNRRIEISWEDLESGNARPDDEVLVLAYNPVLEKWIFRMPAALRRDLFATLPVSPDFYGDTLHVYLFFLNSSRRESSATIYLGTLKV